MTNGATRKKRSLVEGGGFFTWSVCVFSWCFWWFQHHREGWFIVIHVFLWCLNVLSKLNMRQESWPWNCGSTQLTPRKGPSKQVATWHTKPDIQRILRVNSKIRYIWKAIPFPTHSFSVLHVKFQNELKLLYAHSIRKDPRFLSSETKSHFRPSNLLFFGFLKGPRRGRKP